MTLDSAWGRVFLPVPAQRGTEAPTVVVGTGAAPAAVRLAAAVHAGRPGVLAPVADLAVLVPASLALPAGSSRPVAVAAAAAALLLSGRVYRDRDRVVSRGVGWWPRLLVGPLAVAALVGATSAGAHAALAFGVVALLSLCALRGLAWAGLVAVRRRGGDAVGVLVVGTDERARTLARTLERHPEYGLEVVLSVSEALLDDAQQLATLVAQRRIGHVFLVPSGGGAPAGLRRAFGVDAHLSLVPYGSDAFLEGSTGGRVGGVAVLPLGRPLRGPARMRGKRPADVVLSSVLLLSLGPLLGLAALAIRLDDGGPALYRQRRTGRGGQPFDILKLRTMRPGAEAEVGRLTAYNTTDGLLFKMVDDPRVTRTGRVLRRTGLDELPQLVNVLRGEMSLVGPRPLPVAADAFGPREDERHLVRPGMTGLWQVSGGAMLRYREMVDLDVAYAHGWTPGLDLHILAATVGVLLRASLGVSGRER